MRGHWDWRVNLFIVLGKHTVALRGIVRSAYSPHSSGLLQTGGGEIRRNGMY